MELELQKYLRKGNSLQSLAANPYNLKIQENGNLVLFKYNQIESNFSSRIVQEARGIILEKDSWNVVCFPFVKFFNYGEQFAAQIGNKLHVYEKVDGSLAKVWYYAGEWRLSSNGSIDAKEVYINGNQFTFYDLFLKALESYNLTWEQFTRTLSPDFTYMYELCTEKNPVVIQYSGYHLFYLGQRNIWTFQEGYYPDERIENVKQFEFSSLEEAKCAAAQLTDNDEGFVVRDENWNRVKIKNPTYLMLHKMANNGKPNILNFVLEGNENELLAYFPQFKDEVETLKLVLDNIRKEAAKYYFIMQQFFDKDKKTYALFTNQFVESRYRPYIFKCYDNNNLTWAEFTKEWNENKWKVFLK